MGVNDTILGNPKNGTVYLSTVGKAPIVPMSIYGAETAIEDIFNGVRPRVHVNIGKPFGPFKIRGTKEEKDKLFEECSKDKDLMDVVLIALLTGARQGEIIGLRWEDIDFDDDDNIRSPGWIRYQKKLK